MANPFSGIISEELKNTYNNAMDALFEDNALTLPCKFIYAGTKYEDCPNCLTGPAGGFNSIYSHGFGIPTQNIACSVCGGSGKRLVEVEEPTIYLCVIWDYKNFINLSSPISRPDGTIQTLSVLTKTIDQIKQAQEIIVDTSIEPYVAHRFSRAGEPTPCGLGSSRYITTLWTTVN